MENSLHPFAKSIFLDYAFKEKQSSLDNQVVNELTINCLDSLIIEFKENQVTLSSPTPFSLNRIRERVVINHAPQIAWTCRSFLECSIEAIPLYRDEEVPSKVYKNRYKDEVYMQSLVSDTLHNIPTTSLDRQIEIVTAQHQERVDDLVIDQLVDNGQMVAEMRELMHMTLCHACGGVIKPELMTLFQQVKETLVNTHADVFSQALAQDIECVKKWGSLGERDMYACIEKDYALCTQANLLHAVKRSEWILQGSELSQLRFFNLRDKVQHVDFYNRSFMPRGISYGTQPLLGPYEHMRIERRPSSHPALMNEFITYTGGASPTFVQKEIPENDAHNFFKTRLTSGVTTSYSYFEV